MAVHTIRTDDLNGDPDAATVVITVNGKGIEIDVAERSSARLIKALEPFWNVGTESDYDVVRRQRGAKRATSTRTADPGEVRAWANANGIQVNDRGRVPQVIVDQFLRS